MNLNTEEMQLDVEWVRLINEAKSIGLTKGEIQHFLTKCKEDSISE